MELLRRRGIKGHRWLRSIKQPNKSIMNRRESHALFFLWMAQPLRIHQRLIASPSSSYFKSGTVSLFVSRPTCFFVTTCLPPPHPLLLKVVQISWLAGSQANQNIAFKKTQKNTSRHRKAFNSDWFVVVGIFIFYLVSWAYIDDIRHHVYIYIYLYIQTSPVKKVDTPISSLSGQLSTLQIHINWRPQICKLHHRGINKDLPLLLLQLLYEQDMWQRKK